MNSLKVVYFTEYSLSSFLFFTFFAWRHPPLTEKGILDDEGNLCDVSLFKQAYLKCWCVDNAVTHSGVDIWSTRLFLFQMV